MSNMFLKRLGVLSYVAVAACLMCGAGNVHAALLAYEPFEYGDVAVPSEGQYAVGSEDAGTNVLGGQNPVIGPTAFYAGPWIQPGGDSQVVKAVPSLSYPNFQAGIGGIQQETNQFDCCVFGRSARPIGELDPINAPGEFGLGGGRDPRTIYHSFLIDFGGLGTDVDPRTDADPNNDGNIGKHSYEMWNGFNPASPDSSLAVDLFINHFGSVFDLTLAVTTVSGTTSVPVNGGGLTIEALTGVHLVVMKFDFQPTDPDVVSLYFDPTSFIEPLTPSASVSVPNSDLLITHHGAFTQFQFTGAGAAVGAIDEMRWGDIFLDVTPLSIPEPASLSLLGVCMAGLALGRRHK